MQQWIESRSEDAAELRQHLRLQVYSILTANHRHLRTLTTGNCAVLVHPTPEGIIRIELGVISGREGRTPYFANGMYALELTTALDLAAADYQVCRPDERLIFSEPVHGTYASYHEGKAVFHWTSQRDQQGKPAEQLVLLPGKVISYKQDGEEINPPTVHGTPLHEYRLEQQIADGPEKSFAANGYRCVSKRSFDALSKLVRAISSSKPLLRVHGIYDATD
ncbi:hypothetical protein COV18_07495 [Candidatus Woesearchaeota archaeon CG10_big_fil_rev_8_21_14_0_10_37_12]|nr:MAG: hypothetical protein COV18_07495 [Candidatus Woesearchaeota archaeon CG10_big_fil_rev_8_21_14_0_10_37_12]